MPAAYSPWEAYDVFNYRLIIHHALPLLRALVRYLRTMVANSVVNIYRTPLYKTAIRMGINPDVVCILKAKPKTRLGNPVSGVIACNTVYSQLSNILPETHFETLYGSGYMDANEIPHFSNFLLAFHFLSICISATNFDSPSNNALLSSKVTLWLVTPEHVL